MANEIDFMSAMKREHSQLESNMNNNSDNSRPKTKNEIIRIKKEVPQLLLRFLPSVSMLDGAPDAALAVTQRNIMFQANTGSKVFTASLTLPPVVDFDNPVEAKVAQWTQAGNAKLFSIFNGKQQASKIRNTHWINVLQVVSGQNGEMGYVMDTDGTPKVFALSVPDSGYNAILTQITDPLNTIDGQPIITFGRSMPTKLSKPDKTTFSASVYAQPNLALPPIDQNVIVPKLDDFSDISEPSDKSQNDFFQNIISYIEGTPRSTNNSNSIADPVNNYQAPTSSAPANAGIPDPFNMNEGSGQQSDMLSPSDMLSTPTSQPSTNPWAINQVQQPVQQQPVQQPVQQQQQPAQQQQPPVQQPDVSTDAAFNVPNPASGISGQQQQDLNSFLDNL